MLKNRNRSEQESAAKRRLLIYAHYYYPDVASTGQILTELAEGLRDMFQITVICTVPSYSGMIAPSYKDKAYYSEHINGIDLIRVRVPEFAKEKKMSRVRNVTVYFFRAMKATCKLGATDYVYTISQPPILGGILGVTGKWLKHAKFIYNIQDFNPEQIMAVNYSKNKLILGFMKRIDNFNCRRADKVIVVGRDMAETLKVRLQGKKLPDYCFINNWIDEKEIYPLEDSNEKVMEFKKKYGLEDKFVIMYSGNLGLYYDLINILKVIQRFESCQQIIFAFVGDGSVKEELVRYKEKNNINNVVFIPYQDKAELLYTLNAGNVHWVVNAKGIKGVSVPSKLYGVMAAGKPVLGVLEEGSEARIIIEESGCGFIAEPGDYEGIENMLRKVISENRREAEENAVMLNIMGMQGRTYLLRYLKKEISIKKYGKEIISS